MKTINRLVAAVTAACMLATLFPATASASANEPAALVTTQEILNAESSASIDRIRALLNRDDAHAALLARGVDPAAVLARVDALTDEEAALLAQRLDQLPAGAADVVGVLFAVFIILLLTDIFGLTKVFPFTRPIR